MTTKKLSILLLNYEFPPLGGGASPVSYNFAKELAERGMKVDVITMWYKGLPFYEKLSENLTVYRVLCLRSKKEISYPLEQLSYLFSGFIKSVELIIKNKYDFSYCHFIIPTGALAYVIKKLFRIPYILTSHGSDILGYNPRFKKIYPLLSVFWKSFVDEANFVTVPSTFLLNKIKDIYPGINLNKVEIVPNMIEEGYFKAMSKEKYILSIARLHREKGVQDLIEAFHRINNSNWVLKIVGDGPYRDELESTVKRLKLDKQIKFEGWVSDKAKLQDLYGHASIYVNTSYFESFGMTSLEAMMAGCTCVLSKTGIADDVNDVYKYIPGDLNTLTKCLKKTIKDDKIRTSLSYKNYLPKKVMPKLINLFQKVVC